jgi:hypothetical protein
VVDWTALLEGLVYAVKTADHPRDRLKERTKLGPEAVAGLQGKVDALNLSPGHYHLPLRGPGGEVQGYAAFKAAPGRQGPVFATVLAPYMVPKGQSLEGKI